MTGDPVGPPPERGKVEVAAEIVKAGVAAVPIVGGSAAELFELVIAPSIHRRRDEWLRRLGEGVDELRARFDGFDPRQLEGNEAFVSAVMAATPLALKTQDDEKLSMLANAVMNSALDPGGVPEYEQLTFLRLVDELTPLHVRLLAVMADPQEWFDSRPDLQRPNFGFMASPAALIDAALPELAGSREVMQQIDRDLDVRGLIQGGGLMTTMTPQGAWAARGTDLGRRFLAYVSEPV